MQISLLPLISTSVRVFFIHESPRPKRFWGESEPEPSVCSSSCGPDFRRRARSAVRRFKAIVLRQNQIMWRFIQLLNTRLGSPKSPPCFLSSYKIVLSKPSYSVDLLLFFFFVPVPCWKSIILSAVLMVTHQYHVKVRMRFRLGFGCHVTLITW